VIFAITFFGILVLLPVAAHFTSNRGIEVLSAFYRSGALVFGGGHVVLPLLENVVVTPGWVPQSTFLAGYGAAQALPGPLFTFAAFLGASVQGGAHRWVFGVLGLLGMFAPGLLAMAAVLPFWAAIRGNRLIQGALRGINAAVVGILIAALYTPLWTSTIRTAGDFWFALMAFYASHRVEAATLDCCARSKWCLCIHAPCLTNDSASMICLRSRPMSLVCSGLFSITNDLTAGTGCRLDILVVSPERLTS
jgi:chromate transport protein ChrA